MWQRFGVCHDSSDSTNPGSLQSSACSWAPALLPPSFQRQEEEACAGSSHIMLLLFETSTHLSPESCSSGRLKCQMLKF
jgi:hypothetical protein